MIGPAWASNPDSPITVVRQRVLRRYQQRHRGRLIFSTKNLTITPSISKIFLTKFCTFFAKLFSIRLRILFKSVEISLFYLIFSLTHWSIEDYSVYFQRQRVNCLLVCLRGVHRGIIGHGVSQCRSRLLTCSVPMFTRFRNPVDRQVMRAVCHDTIRYDTILCISRVVKSWRVASLVFHAIA